MKKKKKISCCGDGGCFSAGKGRRDDWSSELEYEKDYEKYGREYEREYARLCELQRSLTPEERSKRSEATTTTLGQSTFSRRYSSFDTFDITEEPLDQDLKKVLQQTVDEESDYDVELLDTLVKEAEEAEMLDRRRKQEEEEENRGRKNEERARRKREEEEIEHRKRDDLARREREEQEITRRRSEEIAMREGDEEDITRKRREEMARRKREEEMGWRKRQEEENVRRQREELARKKLEEEENGRRKREDEEIVRRQKEESARRKWEVEENARRKREEEEIARRQREELARRRWEEEESARRKREEEIARRQREDVARRKWEEDENARSKREEEIVRRQREEVARRKWEEEENARSKREEEITRRQREELARRKWEEAENARSKREEEIAGRQTEELVMTKWEDEENAKRKIEEPAGREREDEDVARRRREEQSPREREQDVIAHRSIDELAREKRDEEEEIALKKKEEEEQMEGWQMQQDLSWMSFTQQARNRARGVSMNGDRIDRIHRADSDRYDASPSVSGRSTWSEIGDASRRSMSFREGGWHSEWREVEFLEEEEQEEEVKLIRNRTRRGKQMARDDFDDGASSSTSEFPSDEWDSGKLTNNPFSPLHLGAGFQRKFQRRREELLSRFEEKLLAATKMPRSKLHSRLHSAAMITLGVLGVALLFSLFLLYLSFIAKARPPGECVNERIILSFSATRIRLRGGRYISFREQGVGADRAEHSVVVVHDFLSSRLAGVPGISESLLEEYKVRLISYDRPGYGQSDPHLGRNYNTSAYDIVEIADALNLGEKFWVMGFGGGGPHVWAAINYLPEKLAGVALFAPAGNPYVINMSKEESDETWGALTLRQKWMHRIARRFPALLPRLLQRTAITNSPYVPRNIRLSLGQKV